MTLKGKIEFENNRQKPLLLYDVYGILGLLLWLFWQIMLNDKLKIAGKLRVSEKAAEVITDWLELSIINDTMQIKDIADNLKEKQHYGTVNIEVRDSTENDNKVPHHRSEGGKKHMSSLKKNGQKQNRLESIIEISNNDSNCDSEVDHAQKKQQSTRVELRIEGKISNYSNYSYPPRPQSNKKKQDLVTDCNIEEKDDGKKDSEKNNVNHIKFVHGSR